MVAPPSCTSSWSGDPSRASLERPRPLPTSISPHLLLIPAVGCTARPAPTRPAPPCAGGDIEASRQARGDGLERAHHHLRARASRRSDGAYFRRWASSSGRPTLSIQPTKSLGISAPMRVGSAQRCVPTREFGSLQQHWPSRRLASTLASADPRRWSMRPADPGGDVAMDASDTGACLPSQSKQKAPLVSPTSCATSARLTSVIAVRRPRRPQSQSARESIARPLGTGTALGRDRSSA